MGSNGLVFYPAMVDEEQKYRASEALSQSELKSGLYTNLGEPEPPRAAFTFGSLVDCMAFMPTQVDARFFTATAESDTYARYADDLMARFVEAGMGAEDVVSPGEGFMDADGRVYGVLLDYLNAKGLYANRADEKRVLELAKKVGPLIVTRFERGDRTLVDGEEYAKASLATIALTTHPELGWLVTGENAPSFPEGMEVELYHQRPLYFSVGGIACKALPDIVVRYRDGEKEYLHLIDLKTTSGSIRQFVDRYLDYSYDFQLKWYAYALSELYPTAEIQSSILLVNRDLSYPPTLLENGGMDRLWMQSTVEEAVENYRREEEGKPTRIALDSVRRFGYSVRPCAGTISLDGRVER